VSGYRVENGSLVIAPVLLENRPEEQLPRRLRQRLFKPIRCDSPPYGLTLAAALEQYGKLYGQKLVLDRQAFAEAGEADAGEYPLAGRGRALPEAPCLADILDLVCWQVDGINWKSYYQVRDHSIEVTVVAVGSKRADSLKAHQEHLREYRSIWCDRLNRGVPPSRPVWFDKELASEPLEDVVDFVAERYGSLVIVDQRAFKAAGMDNVEKQLIRLAPKKPLPAEGMVRLICEQLHGTEYVGDCVYRRDGYFEIVPQHRRIHARQLLGTKHLDSLWDDLTSQDGACARLAAQTLMQASRQAVPYLRESIKRRIPRPKAAEVKKLVEELESDRFTVRQRATDLLERIGLQALPALHARLAENPPLEARKRIEQLMTRRSFRQPDIEQVRANRCVQVLEGIGTAEAEELLESLVESPLHGAAARLALKRLNP
jgi:hypothetical protein